MPKYEKYKKASDTQLVITNLRPVTVTLNQLLANREQLEAKRVELEQAMKVVDEAIEQAQKLGIKEVEVPKKNSPDIRKK